jgi:hypothetical protein
MATVKITIKGISPLLMHSYPLVDPVKPLEKMTREEQAEFATYRDPVTKELVIPGVAVQRALVAGAGYHKGKGMATLAKPVAACVLVQEPYLPLGVSVFDIDSRGVVIPATKGRIIRHRPVFSTWGVSFTVDYDDKLITEKQLREVVDSTGSRVGILEYRPEKKGPFGRFMVVEWKS